MSLHSLHNGKQYYNGNSIFNLALEMVMGIYSQGDRPEEEGIGVIATEKKKCTKCGKKKPRIEFSKDSGKKDGLSCHCKECRSKQGRIYNKKTAETRRVKAKKYYSENKDICNERTKAWGKTANGMKSKRETVKRAYHRNIKAGRARTMLRCKVFEGKIIKPKNCELCNRTDCRINGHHHKGYGKEHWYNVQWLCNDCHWKVHHEG